MRPRLSRPRARSNRRLVALLSTLVMSVALCGPLGGVSAAAKGPKKSSGKTARTVAASAQAAETGVISSAGPLARIQVTRDLNCAVNYARDTSPEFYGGTACGTLVVVDDVLYGPANIPAGSGAAPRTAYTAVSQTGPSGSGTLADPYRIVTVVDLGTSGIRLTQVDTYVVGHESFETRVRLANTNDDARQATVYRAGDCFLENSDVGRGLVTAPSVACVSDSDRVQQWNPISGPSHYMQGGYWEVWAHIGSRAPFPDTCRCTERIDNGAGLSWSIEIPAGGERVITSSIAFATGDELDSDGDALLDEWETDGYDADNDGVVDLDLPAMGASPDHKDMFIEVDWMQRARTCFWFLCWGGRSFAPSESALADVRSAFEASPMTNPDGTTGVRVHIDAGPSSIMDAETGALWGARSRANSVDHVRSLGEIVGEDYDWSEFATLQQDNFESVRRDVFRYALFADRYADSDSSGIARGIPGDAFLVTDGPAGQGGFSRRQESGTFMHELGHTLNLTHGGADPGRHMPYKPNYESILNYTWQMGGELGPHGIDYSRRALATLDEAALSEGDGLVTTSGNVMYFCPDRSAALVPSGPDVDWNCNDEIEADPVAADINCGPDCAGALGHTQMGSANDYSLIEFDGGSIGAFGVADPDDQDPPPTFTPLIEPTLDELRRSGYYAANGDANVAFVGPETLFLGTVGQQLLFDVTNLGSSEADYEVHVEAPGAGGTSDVSLEDVAGGATERVRVPAESLAIGTHDVVVTVSTPGGRELAVARGLVTVVDPEDVSVRDHAGEVLELLRQGPVEDMDPEIRTRLITAIRTLTETPLTISVGGPGGGRVTSDPAGIDCGGDCSETYPTGTRVTLRAEPNATSSFTGWSGECGRTAECTITLSDAATVTATFDRIAGGGQQPPAQRYSLNVQTAGSGVVSSTPAGISCGSDCTESFVGGTSVTLTAAPVGSFAFVGWSGSCSGTTTCTVSMDQPRQVTATFAAIPAPSPAERHTLTVTRSDPGAGTVTSVPSGIDCGGDCSEAYPAGATVTLVATPANGFVFTGWSGDCRAFETCSVTMSAARLVHAAFVADRKPPVSTIDTPHHRTVYPSSSIRTVTGTARDEAAVVQVEVALARKSNGSCEWWNGERFVPGSCRRTVWNRAEGTTEWSYGLPALRRSFGTKVNKYLVYSRATDEHGNVESVFRRGRNRNRFDVIKWTAQKMYV